MKKTAAATGISNETRDCKQDFDQKQHHRLILSVYLAIWILVLDRGSQGNNIPCNDQQQRKDNLWEVHLALKKITKSPENLCPTVGQ